MGTEWLGIEIPEIYDGISVWYNEQTGEYKNRWDKQQYPGRWERTQQWIEKAKKGSAHE